MPINASKLLIEMPRPVLRLLNLTEKFLEVTALANGLGITLIALGTIGLYFSQPMTVSNNAENLKKNRILSYGAYGSVFLGLIIIIQTTYCTKTLSNLLSRYALSLSQK